jgi:hypothetical protein
MRIEDKEKPAYLLHVGYAYDLICSAIAEYFLILARADTAVMFDFSMHPGGELHYTHTAWELDKSCWWHSPNSIQVEQCRVLAHQHPRDRHRGSKQIPEDESS